MSDSESMQEVPLGFLQEENGDSDAKIVMMLEDKKPSMVLPFSDSETTT